MSTNNIGTTELASPANFVPVVCVAPSHPRHVLGSAMGEEGVQRTYAMILVAPMSNSLQNSLSALSSSRSAFAMVPIPVNI